MTSAELSQTIAHALREAGVDTVFGMPGGGNNLDLIGALETERIRFVLAHAETPAAIMASAYADLSGRPTGCLVTRGPGAASAVNGVSNALLDRSPVVLITDAVSSDDHARIAHQRLDQRALFAPITHWSATVGIDAHDTVRHALRVATGAQPGPVHLDFDPTAPSTPVPTPTPHAPLAPATSLATDPSLAAARGLLAAARRPVVVLGVGARPHAAEVGAFLGASAAPVLMTYRAKGLVPDTSPTAAGLFTGATTEAPLLAAADLLVFIGVDTVELIPAAWPHPAPVLSINTWPETSSYLDFAAELVGDIGTTLETLSERRPAGDWLPDAGNRHRDAELTRLRAAGPALTDGISPQEVVQQARSLAPAGSIATVDAGAHMLPAMCLWDTEAVDEVLISSGLATMGYALPAAIGAALARPGRRVVAFTGDGGLGMCLGELETIRRLNLPITVVVFNDARLSLISIKAKPTGNGGEKAVAYAPTSFATVAEGYGLPSARVDSPDELATALAALFAQNGPSLIDARVDPAGYAEILAVIRGGRPASLPGVDFLRD